MSTTLSSWDDLTIPPQARGRGVTLNLFDQLSAYIPSARGRTCGSPPTASAWKPVLIAKAVVIRLNLINDSNRHMARMMCVTALKSSEDSSRRVARMHLVATQLGKTQGCIAYGWIRKGPDKGKLRRFLLRQLVSRVRAAQPGARADQRSLRSVTDTELFQDVRDVHGHGPVADIERAGDLPVALPLPEQRRYLRLPPGEVEAGTGGGGPGDQGERLAEPGVNRHSLGVAQQRGGSERLSTA